MKHTSTLLLGLALTSPFVSFASSLDTPRTSNQRLIHNKNTNDLRESEQVQALFASNSSRLSSAASSSLDPLIARAKFSATTIFSLAGYSDAVGSKNHNLVLSIERVNAVRDYLIDNGVRPDRIHTTAHGETRAAINIQNAEALVLDRRVVITTSFTDERRNTSAKLPTIHSYALRDK